MLLAACASRPQRLPDLERELAPVAAPGIGATDAASAVALQALAYLGTPYRAGGLSPKTGFDCSGLVAYAYREGAGVVLPRNTSELSVAGVAIEPDGLRPGDLVFYDTQRRPYSHVGIYLGNERFIHAPSSGGEVRVENLRASYWLRRFNGARRIIGSSS